MERTQNTPAVPLPLAPPTRSSRRQALHQQYKNWLQGDLDRTFLLWLKQRFIERQTQRRRQVHARLTRTQADVLQLLPFLFHCNHPNLPGYLKDAPKGIYGYVPGRSERATLRRWAPAYRYSPGREAHIHAIFLMGSAGSVAHTRASDLDVWVCVDDKDIHTTQAKIDNLAKWAALHNVELQGFAVSTEQFTNRTSLVTTPLLLDEFYRSSCHLAGKLPLWMLVPPGANTNRQVG